MIKSLAPTRKLFKYYRYGTEVFTIVYNYFPIITVIVNLIIGGDTRIYLPYQIYYPFDPYYNDIIAGVMYISQAHAGMY
jgi:hypothetical protein